jgi:hypothetical protein
MLIPCTPSLEHSLLFALLREVVLLLEEVALDLGVLEQLEIPFCAASAPYPHKYIP